MDIEQRNLTHLILFINVSGKKKFHLRLVLQEWNGPTTLASPAVFGSFLWTQKLFGSSLSLNQSHSTWVSHAHAVLWCHYSPCHVSFSSTQYIVVKCVCVCGLADVQSYNPELFQRLWPFAYLPTCNILLMQSWLNIYFYVSSFAESCRHTCIFHHFIFLSVPSISHSM